MKDSSSIPMKVFLVLRALYRAGEVVYKWGRRYPKLAAFIILTPLLLVFCYFVAIISMESEDWQTRHCRKTGRSNIPNVVVVGDFPLTPSVQAQYEYECDDGTMKWLSY